MRSIGILALMLFCLVGPAQAGKVQVSQHPEADLSKYETYTWQEGVEAPDAQVQRWIVEAIDRELQAKGMRRVDDGSAGLYLKSYVAGALDTELWGNYAVSPTWNVGIWHAEARTMGRGALAVILSDAATEEHVWIGIASKAGTGDVKKSKVDKAAAKLFADFPSR